MSRQVAVVYTTRDFKIGCVRELQYAWLTRVVAIWSTDLGKRSVDDAGHVDKRCLMEDRARQ